MSEVISMSTVGMSLDDIARQEGMKGRKTRGRGIRKGDRRTPVTSTQQRRKSLETHNERAQKHRNERNERNSRRLFQDKEKPQYVPVVFGNGAPEKVLTGRLTEAQVSKQGKEPAKQTKKEEPVSLIQAALDRGREVYMQKQARSRGKEQGGKRASITKEPRRRPVIQPTISRKLHIVRPGDPGYKRQLRQLRDRTYAVRLISKTQERKFRDQPKRTQKTEMRDGGQRLMGPQSRRIALGASSNTTSSGPLSNRFSTLSQK